MQLILTIVVDGENAMGEPLCRLNGFLRGAKYKELKYEGPVTSAKDVADLIMDMFKEAPCEK